MGLKLLLEVENFYVNPEHLQQQPPQGPASGFSFVDLLSVKKNSRKQRGVKSLDLSSRSS